MKIGVISDTHIPGKAKRLPEKLLRDLNGVDLIIHAGDIVNQEVLVDLEKIAPVKAVAGNVDPPSLRKILPKKLELEINGFKIGVTHGDQLGGDIINKIAYLFAESDIIIFGHTHKPFNQKIKGQLYFNPGSPTDRRLQSHHTYGIISLDNEIKSKIFEF